MRTFWKVIGFLAVIAVVVLCYLVFMVTETALQLTMGQANAVPTREEVETSGEQVLADPADESRTVASSNLSLLRDPWQTPVRCEESFNEESDWLICEPGVILDNTAAWVIPSVDATHFANVPEGGFTYFSMGEGVIVIDGVALELPGEHGLNYLVLVRGRIDDTIVDSDLNTAAQVTEFVPGHAIWSIMPPGAYVSKDWFEDQMEVSSTTGGTNCGATGCSRIRVVLFDVDSHFYQMFEVEAGDLDDWVLLQEN